VAVHSRAFEPAKVLISLQDGTAYDGEPQRALGVD
jgi:hypothetical protein